MKEIFKHYFFPALLVLLGLAYGFRPTYGLVVNELSSSVIFEENIKINGLVASYNNIPLKKMVSSVISLENIGNQPITGSDVTSPLTIRFNAKILNAAVESAWKDFFPIYISEEGDSLTINIELLNGGENVRIDVLTTDNIQISPTARIKNIKTIRIKEGEAKRTKQSNIIFVIFGSIFSGLFLWGVTENIIRRICYKKMFALDGYNLPQCKNKNQFIDWCKLNFKYVLNIKELSAIEEKISKFENIDNYSLVYHSELMHILKEELEISPKIVIWAIVCFMVLGLTLYLLIFYGLSYL